MIDFKELQISLSDLLSKLPNYNSAYAEEELSYILTNYKKILDTVHNINENLKRNTNLYYSEISSLESEIHNSKWGKSTKSKNDSFNSARNGLESDIQALLSLIDRQ